MKSMQYGWTDMGQCRYLRRRGGDQQIDPSGVNTLAKDTMKVICILILSCITRLEMRTHQN